MRVLAGGMRVFAGGMRVLAGGGGVRSGGRRAGALLGLTALLLACAAAFAALQSVGAQTPEQPNRMQTGDDADRSNFRLELSLVEDSDNVVQAGSLVRVRAVVKFDVPTDKANGIGEGEHGRFGSAFLLQAGSTLHIVGPRSLEWENAGGRILRIDPDRMGSWTDDDPSLSHDCGSLDDYTDTIGRIIWSTTNMNYQGSTFDYCGTPPTKANNRVLDPRADDWKFFPYSRFGRIGNGYDVMPDRAGQQGPCKERTADGATTWACELNVVDEQFGWRGQSGYASLNGVLPESTPNSNVNWAAHFLVPQRQRNDTDAAITIPVGTPDGEFTISGSVVLHSRVGRVPAQAARNADKLVLTDHLVVTVGRAVSEAVSAEFGFAPQAAGDLAPAPLGRAGEPWPSRASAQGGETRLQLRILNANGQPAGRGSVGSIAMRTNLGRLSSNIPDGEADNDGCVGTGARNCQLPVSGLGTGNSGNIVFTLSAPADNQAGTAQVTGLVVNSDGETLPIGTLTVSFAGAASTLSLSEPSSSVLNVAATEANDNRDRLTLSVLAADAGGQRAEVPERARAVSVRDPDGNRVALSDSGISVVWPLVDEDGAELRDGEGNLQARIAVGAEAERALQTGEYTLEVRAGGLKASKRFVVAGEATNIEVVSSSSAYGPNEEFTLTAMVTNADGSTVPDGTRVSFTTSTAATGRTRIVQLSAPERTKNGQSSATYLVVAAGRAWVTVSSGAGNDIWSADVGAAAAADPLAELTGRSGLVAYLGDASVRASALLEALGGGRTIWLYHAGVWLRYGEVGGLAIPGSRDFSVSRGSVLWIGG